MNYIPQAGDRVKNVNIVVNVMQKEYPANPLNFSNTPAHIEAIRSFLFDYYIVEHNKHPFRVLQFNAYNGVEYPNDPYIQDGKIQPKIIEINFIQDNIGWKNDNEECGTYNFDRYKGQGDKTDVALMVYLVEGIIVGSPPALWSVGGCGPGNYLILHGLFKSYLENGENPDSYTPNWLAIRELAAHEMGHSLGSLTHTFSFTCDINYICDFDDIIPCPTYCNDCYPYENNTAKPNCSNNLMSYATVKRYFSPKQLGSIHRGLTRGNFARYIEHIADSPASDIYISTTQLWDVDRFVFGDIYVEPGATLTVRCLVYMPPKSRIIVKRGARLIVDCGKITTNRNPLNSQQQFPTGDYWNGIEVWGNTTIAQTLAMRNPNYAQQLNDPGIVILNNAEIGHAKPAISTIQRGAYSWEVKKTNFGGLVYATNTVFSNNRRTAEFLKYDFPNLSAFVNCTFEDNAEGSSCVTIWETDGILFDNCHFSDVTLMGVLAFDATVKVVGSDFTRVHHGVENYSSYPMSSTLQVVSSESGKRNLFDNCEVGVFFTATGNADIARNDFTENLTGIYATGECQYNIRVNNFLNCQVGLQSSQTLNSGNNLARCNNFNQDNLGILYEGDNGGARILYNEFSFDAGASFNVQLSATTDLTHFYLGKIRNPQMNEDGTNGDLTAGNLFAITPGPTKRHIVSSTVSDLPFTYHVSNYTFLERVYPICGINAAICGQQWSGQNFDYRPYLNINHNAGYCSSIPPSPCNNTTCYGPIKSAYDQAVIAYQNYPTQSNLWNLAITRTRKYESLRSVLLALQQTSDYNSYVSVVNNEQNDFGRRSKLWYYLNREDWAGARQYLNSFVINNEGDQAFVDIQNINVNRLEGGLDYVLSLSNKNLLKALANTVLPERGHARAILVQMLDTIYEPEIPEEIDQRSSGEKENEINNLVKIWPNPTFEFLHVEFGNLWKEENLYTIKVSSLDGREIYQYNLENASNTIDISHIPDGFYIVHVLTGENTLAVEKFVKTR